MLSSEDYAEYAIPQDALDDPFNLFIQQGKKILEADFGDVDPQKGHQNQFCIFKENNIFYVGNGQISQNKCVIQGAGCCSVPTKENTVLSIGIGTKIPFISVSLKIKKSHRVRSKK